MFVKNNNFISLLQKFKAQLAASVCQNNVEHKSDNCQNCPLLEIQTQMCWEERGGPMTTVSTCWFLQYFCSKTKNNSLQLKGSLGGDPKPKEQSISKLNLKMILFLCFRDSYLPSAGIKAVYHIPEKKQSNKSMAHFTMYSLKVQTHNPMCQSLWVTGSI